MSVYNFEDIDLWENRPAQLEEINQCIYNHQGIDEWYCFDTADLLERQGNPETGKEGVVSGEDDYTGITWTGYYWRWNGYYYGTLEEAHQKKLSVPYPLYQRWGTYNESDPPSSTIGTNSRGWPLRIEIVDLRYDFMVINTVNNLVYETDSEGNYVRDEDEHAIIDWSKSSITYTFLVRNTLWDGTIQLFKSRSATPITADVDIWINDVNNTVELIIYGEQAQSIRVCFHMTQIGSGRQGSNIQLINEEEYTEQFDKSYMHKGFVYDTLSMEGLKDVNVKLEPCDSKGNVLDSGLPKTKTITPNSEKSTYVGADLTRTVGDETITIIANNTKSWGVFSLEYGAVSQPGTYYALLTATYERAGSPYESKQVVKVNKVQENSRHIKWGDTYTAYKGSRKEFTVSLSVTNKYGVEDNLESTLKGHNATVFQVRDNKDVDYQQVTVDSKGKLTFKMDYRKFYEDKSKIRVMLSPIDGFPLLTGEQEVTHSYFMSGDFDEIRKECADDDGADFILVEEGTVKNTSSEPITITRDQTISGMKNRGKRTTNDGWATFDGDTNNNPIIHVPRGNGTEAHTVCNLNGLKFQNAKKAISTEKYTTLNVSQCYFTSNKNGNRAQGTCIMNDPYTTVNGTITNEFEKIKKGKTWFTTVIQDSYFYNNFGNCIYSLGTTDIKNNLFRTNNYDCLIQPEPKIVIVDAGDVTYDYNKSHIKVTKYYKSSHSWAKATCFVNYNATFNKKGPDLLKNDDTLPLFSFNSDYHNEAYTYAIYHYDPTGHDLVCYPSDGGQYSKGYYYGKRNRERSATGHGSAGMNPVVNQWMGDKPMKTWVYYDGYLFNYWRNGKNLYNTHDPWTDSELSIPADGGVYDPVKKKFDKGFAPVSAEVVSVQEQMMSDSLSSYDEFLKK